MTHDRPYLDTATRRELEIMLQYVVERREEAEDSMRHTIRRFSDWQERNPEPKLPPILRNLERLDEIKGYEDLQEFLADVDAVELVNQILHYATGLGLYHGMWSSHQGDADHYGGQTDILRCMESELIWHLGKTNRG